MPRRTFALGSRPLILYLAFLSAFAPLSTDMYLPALPSMAASLETTDALSSLSISCFLLLFALSMLFWGPYSDRVGRRRVLMLGALLYVVSSVGIALAAGIESLLIWRGVQAVGSGGISAMSLAIVKDVLRGPVMTRVITWIQTITILAPMLAPVVGGLLLTVTSWRGIFVCLALCGLLAGAGSLLLQETLPARSAGGAGRMLQRIAYVLGQRGFSSLLLIFSIVCMPFMAFLAVSSYVYQNLFGVAPQTYSLFFAVNAGMSLLGPLCYGRWFASWPLRRYFALFLGIIALAGVGLLLMGSWHPVVFALLCAPISFCSSAMRPPSTVLMLHQLSTDTGTMTALINSGGLLFGSTSMFLCSLPCWPDGIAAMGGIACLAGLAALAGWLWADGRQIYRRI
ncbi:MFS transporter [uncultured Desulfovibrio sp.]|uniref:MFS transporter n=1 Tax=Candidatus Desulfovibrio intestinavium TaxID=2838534 RepID=A0A9D2KRF3_9BACT|nr:MFS transporter [uncultured Desulfovibrio sp.]HJA78810.1 MFS transporter [Candidatus Desulfovibrio intestinavium]